MGRIDVRNRVFAAITRSGNTKLGKRVAEFVDSLDRSFENDNSNHMTNGESWLVDQIAPLGPQVIVDVGANVGTWSDMVLSRCPRAHVYAFEPVAATFRQLEARLSAHPRLSTRHIALTAPESEGVLQMWTGGHSTLASAVWQSGPNDVPVEVEACAGDSWKLQEGIEHIDLLKVDTEGHDLEVLRGFSTSLESGLIDVVQFEFTLFAIYARTWLADFYALFEPLGFVVGKLYPSWIDWRAYDAHDERFLRCNFVAVRQGSRAFDRLVGTAA